jgi:hypothetical protein
MTMPGPFLDSMIAATGASMVAGFIAIIRSQMLLNRNVGKLVKMDELWATDLEAIARVQSPKANAHRRQGIP